MKKTQFKVAILKNGTESEMILRAIGSHNEGLVPLCVEDFISYCQFRCAMYPFMKATFWAEKGDEESEIRITEDGGKTWTLLIQEITIEELKEELV